MAFDNFLGTWNVFLTSATPFGFESAITFGGNEDAPTVEFVPPVSEQDLIVEYEEEADQVKILGIPGLKELVFAYFIDPDYQDPESEDFFFAIYGIGRLAEAPKMWSLAVCTALWAPQDASPNLISKPTGIAAAEVTRTFRIVVTSGSQFGVFSSLSVDHEANEEEGYPLVITDALGRTMPPVNLYATGAGETLQGVIPGVTGVYPRTAVQCSFVELGVKRVFGLAVVGDPENSGTWGGDAVAPPDTPQLRPRSDSVRNLRQ